MRRLESTSLMTLEHYLALAATALCWFEPTSPTSRSLGELPRGSTWVAACACPDPRPPGSSVACAAPPSSPIPPTTLSALTRPRPPCRHLSRTNLAAALNLELAAFQTLAHTGSAHGPHVANRGRPTLTFCANCSEESVSLACSVDGARLHIMSAFASPPSESCSSMVSLELR
jgi:hypothetical protein